jgi:hypothetical protein
VPHIKTAAVDTTRWAETEDGRVIAPPCCGGNGPNRCDYPKVPTDPLQLPERLRGGWTEGMKKAAWCNYVSLQTLKAQRQRQLKAAATADSVADLQSYSMASAGSDSESVSTSSPKSIRSKQLFVVCFLVLH